MSKIAIIEFIKSGYANIKQCNNSLFCTMVDCKDQLNSCRENTGVTPVIFEPSFQL